MSEIKANRTQAMRYRRSALAALGYDEIERKLDEIQEACSNVHYFFEQDDDETLLNALDGDTEAEWEFKIAFADLEAKAEQLSSIIGERYGWGDDGFAKTYNDCTVALIGKRYKVLGWDSEEEDYFSLTSYEEGLAHTEAGKRLMRKTKADMIATIGQCLGMLIAFLDLQQ